MSYICTLKQYYIMDASGIGKGIVQIFIGTMVVVALIVAFFTWGITFMVTSTDSTITSKTIIQPELQLIIEDNKVDTLYIYRGHE